MIALYILLGILGFLCLVGFLPVTVRLHARYPKVRPHDSLVQVQVLVAGIRLKGAETRLTGQATKKPKDEQAKKQTPKEGRGKRLLGLMKSKEQIREVLRLFEGLLKPVLRKMAKYSTITVKKARIVVAGGDPADMAILYGAVSALVANIVGVLSEMFRFSFSRSCEKDLRCDFLQKQPEVDCVLDARLLIWQIVGVALTALMPIIRFRTKQKGYDVDSLRKETSSSETKIETEKPTEDGSQEKNMHEKGE